MCQAEAERTYKVVILRDGITEEEIARFEALLNQGHRLDDWVPISRNQSAVILYKCLSEKK